jgi:hypothetical protein
LVPKKKEKNIELLSFERSALGTVIGLRFQSRVFDLAKNQILIFVFTTCGKGAADFMHTQNSWGLRLLIPILVRTENLSSTQAETPYQVTLNQPYDQNVCKLLVYKIGEGPPLLTEEMDLP